MSELARALVEIAGVGFCGLATQWLVARRRPRWCKRHSIEIPAGQACPDCIHDYRRRRIIYEENRRRSP